MTSINFSALTVIPKPTSKAFDIPGRIPNQLFHKVLFFLEQKYFYHPHLHYHDWQHRIKIDREILSLTCKEYNKKIKEISILEYSNVQVVFERFRKILSGSDLEKFNKIVGKQSFKIPVISEKEKIIRLFHYLENSSITPYSNREFILTLSYYSKKHSYTNGAYLWTMTSLQNASQDILKDREVVKAASKVNADALLAPFNADLDLVLEVALSNPYIMRTIADSLRSNAKIVRIAVLASLNLFQYVHASLRSDAKFMQEIIRVNPSAINYAMETIIIDEIRKDPFLIRYVETRGQLIKKEFYKKVALEAVRANHQVIPFIAIDVLIQEDFQNELSKIVPDYKDLYDSIYQGGRNRNGQAHGQGKLLRDFEKLFEGTFENGTMISGKKTIVNVIAKGFLDGALMP